MTATPTAPHDAIVLAPCDELDLSAVPELRARLAAAHRPGATVVLDLDGVTFLDSSALSIVLAADRRLRATGGMLRLAHVSAPVGRVLRIVGLAGLVMPAGGRLRRRCRAAHLVH